MTEETIEYGIVLILAGLLRIDLAKYLKERAVWPWCGEVQWLRR